MPPIVFSSASWPRGVVLAGHLATFFVPARGSSSGSFRPEALVVSEEVAGRFLVLGYGHGPVSVQFLGGIPARAFDESRPFELRELIASEAFFLYVQNVSGEDAPFRAELREEGAQAAPEAAEPPLVPAWPEVLTDEALRVLSTPTPEETDFPSIERDQLRAAFEVQGAELAAYRARYGPLGPPPQPEGLDRELGWAPPTLPGLFATLAASDPGRGPCDGETHPGEPCPEGAQLFGQREGASLTAPICRWCLLHAPLGNEGGWSLPIKRKVPAP